MSNFSNTLKDNFTKLPNEIYDIMNYKQIGVFAYLASRSTFWDFSADRIAEKIKVSYRTVLKILSEIEELGYLTRTKNKNGRMNYILHTPTTIPASRTRKKPKCKNVRVAKMQGAKSTPISKKDFKVIKKQIKESKPKKKIKKDETSLKKSSCLLVSDNSSFLKTIDEMTDNGFNWSSETLLKRVLEACPDLKNRENAMEAVILYWKKVQRKKCEADSWNSNGIWVSKNLVPNAGRYYLKCQKEERAKKERIIELHNGLVIQCVSDKFFAERVRETKAMLNVECLS